MTFTSQEASPPAHNERTAHTDQATTNTEATNTATTTATSADPPTRSFADFGLPSELLDTLREAGMNAPFPIQAATLPDALAGRDVLGRAETGSGKTLAFGLAMLATLRGGTARPRTPRALVLVPTRELAMQVADALTPLAKASGLWCRTVVGGMSFVKQADALKRGVDLLIATPGRLSDHVRQGTCVLSDIGFTTLDEADQMADMGFLPQVTEILDLTPRSGQRLMFSASLDGAVSSLVRDYLADPVEHSVAPATASVSTMEHHVVSVDSRDKHTVTSQIAARDGRSILFVRTKHHADRVAEQLRKVGVAAIALHGGKTQGQRNKVLDAFKGGTATTLVATDVAARGIHVDDVSLVLHVDAPADPKDYMHRAGRTARAGASGTVVTLITPNQRRAVRRMTDRAGVRPNLVAVKPGDSELTRITGARTPSGEPVPEPQPRRKPASNTRRDRNGHPPHRRTRRPETHERNKHRNTNGGSRRNRRAGQAR